MREKLYELIMKNRSLKDIASELNVSEKELWIKIKQMISYGYNIQCSYSYNGNIFFKPNKSHIINPDEERQILIPSDIKEFRFVVISDLHVGSNESSLKLLSLVYDYAIKNDINTIFICGDQIQGYYGKNPSLDIVERQVETFIKGFPYDKNILNYMILGNHDYRSLHCLGFDISRRISSLRYDIIPVGYGIGNIRLKDDFITLKHELECIDLDYSKILGQIVLSGHGHMMKIKIMDRIYVCAPSLSYNSPDNTRKNIPGFLDILLSFERKKIGTIYVDYFIIDPEIQKASENKIKMKNISNNQN